MNDVREKLRTILADAIMNVHSEADIRAIETQCPIFHGKDAGECILRKIQAYGTPIYGANGGVVVWEVNKQLLFKGIDDKTDTEV